MKNIFTFLLLVFIGGQFLWGQPANLVWNIQSRNASESMPCGGGDIGMNVWVENERVGECAWEVALVIPYSAFFLHDITSLDGKTLRANFYKCGDKLQTPHFLSWNPWMMLMN